MSLKEKIREQAKTLAQLGRKCISLNRMCKDCTGDCEFEGTPTFLGRFVSVDVVSDLLDKAIEQIQNELKTLYEFVVREHLDSKEYWEFEKGKILQTKINVLEWVLSVLEGVV